MKMFWNEGELLEGVDNIKSVQINSKEEKMFIEYTEDIIWDTDDEEYSNFEEVDLSDHGVFRIKEYALYKMNEKLEKNTAGSPTWPTRAVPATGTPHFIKTHLFDEFTGKIIHAIAVVDFEKGNDLFIVEHGKLNETKYRKGNIEFITDKTLQDSTLEGLKKFSKKHDNLVPQS